MDHEAAPPSRSCARSAEEKPTRSPASSNVSRRRHRESDVLEGSAQRPLARGFEGEGQIEDRRRREDEHIVHQRDGLVMGDARALLVHHGIQSRDAHPERRCAVHVLVQDIDRHASARGLHVEEARRRIEELELRGAGLHPRRRRAAAHLGGEHHAQVAHTRSADGSSAAQVRPHQRRQRREIGVGDERGRARGARQQHVPVAYKTRPEAVGPCVQRGDQQRDRDDQVGDGPELRVAPRGHDRRLRQQHARRCRVAPPSRADGHARRSRDEQDGCHQPQHAGRAGDGCPQLTDVRPPERLGGAEEMDQSMQRDQRGENEPHGSELLQRCRSMPPHVHL